MDRRPRDRLRPLPRRPRSAASACLVAVAEIHEILIPSGAKPIRPLDAREGRRLAETVRALDRRPRTAARPRRHPRAEHRRHHRLDRPGREGREDAWPKRCPSRRQPRLRAKPAGGRRHLEHPSLGQRATCRCRCRRHRRYRASARPNSASISAAPARSRRCAPPGPRRCAATARCSRACIPWCRPRASPVPAGWNCASLPGRFRTPQRQPGSAPR